jgi:hypothetical protein
LLSYSVYLIYCKKVQMLTSQELGVRGPGAQFTCFTGTNLQTLTSEQLRARRRATLRYFCFTCFTVSKVLAWASTKVQIQISLALLVKKYKY